MIKKIANQTLILGNSLEIMPELDHFDHLISDPPYEQRMHDSKSSQVNSPNKDHRGLRTDGRRELQALDFNGIDNIRHEFIKLSSQIVLKWFIVFCTVQGTAYWAEAINESQMKYKRACAWVKPDCTPQLNGQCPAQGFECFVTAWCGQGHSKWNSGGKRGVYTHFVNPSDRDGRHPTEKPHRLMSEIIRDFVQPEDIILDPFMGSGTTLISAHRMGLSATGIEMNPDYFDVAVERLKREETQSSLFQVHYIKPKQEKMKL
jgi:site-specific DNA-methyltransferase (adenine-specific)